MDKIARLEHQLKTARLEEQLKSARKERDQFSRKGSTSAGVILAAAALGGGVLALDKILGWGLVFNAPPPRLGSWADNTGVDRDRGQYGR